MIYFLPGRGSSFQGRLGTELQSRGYELSDRILEGEFAKLPFPDQINLIADDLAKYSKKQTPLIAHSFGAYLGLHAILQNRNHAGKVLLISPILGAVKGNGRMFKPPQSKRIAEAIETRQLPKLDMDVLVGDQDWQSPLVECDVLVSACGLNLNIAPGKSRARSSCKRWSCIGFDEVRSEQSKGWHKYFIWQCESGHKWSASFNAVNDAGRWCKECFKIREMQNK